MKREGLQAWRMEGRRRVWGEGGLQTGRDEEAGGSWDSWRMLPAWLDMRSGKDEGVREESEWGLGTPRRKGAGDSLWHVRHTVGA